MSNTEPIPVLIINGHTMIRTALRILIEKYPKITVIGEAGDCAEGISVLDSMHPSVILLDLDLADDTAFDSIARLRAVSNGVRLLVLTGLRDPQLYNRLMLSGAVGIVHKERAADVLIKAIEKVHEGEVWFERSTIANLLNELSRRDTIQPADPEVDKIATLTDRERQVIALVCTGLKNKQIGERLFVSESTVRHHLGSIFGKLGVSGRFELIIYAHRHNLSTIVE